MKIFGYEFSLWSQPKPSDRQSRIEREPTRCPYCINRTRTLVMKNPDQRFCVECMRSK